MSIKHNHPKSFFKYMTASTAEIVLKTRTLRWSHPSIFDDTLDVAQVCDEKMDKNKQKQIQDLVIDLAASPPANLKTINVNPLFEMSALILSLFNDTTSIVLELKKNLFSDISSAIAGINECWVKDIRNNFRILCLGIENDNHRLWNDYAEAYKGVVIELACRDDSDSPWRIAKPVEYVNEKDLFLTVDDWAMVAILKSIEGAKYITEKCCLRKAKDNEHKWYEQNEWRIPSFRRNNEIGLISDYGVNPNDFRAIYFGYKMDVETRNKLLGLLSGELNHVSAYQSKIDSTGNITFTKLK